MYMEQGIRCNGIAPGGVVTDIPLVMPKADEFGFSRTSSLLVHSPELGMPEDIANAALFLASDESSFINGVILTCDGAGQTYRLYVLTQNMECREFLSGIFREMSAAFFLHKRKW